MVEFHPFYDALSGYQYFPKTQPDIEQEATYTENAGEAQQTIVTWPHSLSEVLNALLTAGLQITQLNEFAYSPYPCFEGLVEREKGQFYLARDGADMPLLYSVKAKKCLG